MARYFGGFRDRLKKRSKNQPLTEKDVEWVKVATTFSWSPARKEYQWLDPEDYLTSFLSSGDPVDSDTSHGDGFMNAGGAVDDGFSEYEWVDESATDEGADDGYADSANDFATPEQSPAAEASDPHILRPDIDVPAELPTLDEYKLELMSALKRRGVGITIDKITVPDDLEGHLNKYHQGGASINSYELRARLQQFKKQVIESYESLNSISSSVRVRDFSDRISPPSEDEELLNAEDDEDYESFILKSLNRLEATMREEEETGEEEPPVIEESPRPAPENPHIRSSRGPNRTIPTTRSADDRNEGEETPPLVPLPEPPSTFADDSWLVLPVDATPDSPRDSTDADETTGQELLPRAGIHEDEHSGEESAAEASLAYSADLLKALNTMGSRFPEDMYTEGDDTLTPANGLGLYPENRNESPSEEDLEKPHQEALEEENHTTASYVHERLQGAEPDDENEKQDIESQELDSVRSSFEEEDTPLSDLILQLRHDADSTLVHRETPDDDRIIAVPIEDDYEETESIFDVPAEEEAAVEEEVTDELTVNPSNTADDGDLGIDFDIEDTPEMLVDVEPELRDTDSEEIWDEQDIEAGDDADFAFEESMLDRLEKASELIEAEFEMAEDEPDLDEPAASVVEELDLEEAADVPAAPEVEVSEEEDDRQLRIEREREKLFSIIDRLEKRNPLRVDVDDKPDEPEEEAVGESLSPEAEKLTVDEKLEASIEEESTADTVAPSGEREKRHEEAGEVVESDSTEAGAVDLDEVSVQDEPKIAIDALIADVRSEEEEIADAYVEEEDIETDSDQVPEEIDLEEADADSVENEELADEAVEPANAAAPSQGVTNDESLDGVEEPPREEEILQDLETDPESEITAETVDAAPEESKAPPIWHAFEEEPEGDVELGTAFTKRTAAIKGPEVVPIVKQDISVPSEETTNGDLTLTDVGEGEAGSNGKAVEEHADLSETEEPTPGDVVLEGVIEAIAFATEEPFPLKKIARIYAELQQVRAPSEKQLVNAVEKLNADYEETGRAFRVKLWGGGVRMVSHPHYARFIRALYEDHRPKKLSRTLMETLAIIAYSQPTTKPEVDFVRGVDSDYAVRKLLELGLIDIVGRSEAIGRPLLYGTSERFLEQFGLSQLEALPKLKEVEELLGDPAFKKERLHLLALEGMDEVAQAAGEKSEDQAEEETPEKGERE